MMKRFLVFSFIISFTNFANAQSLLFRDMINNGSDSDGGLTGTYSVFAAGNAATSNVPGNSNHGNATAGGSLTILNQDSDVTDGNNSDGNLGNDTLNNYIVHAFSFNQAVILAEPFRIHDLDWDHAGTNEYQDAVSLVVGLNGNLSNPSGTTPSTLPAGTSPNGSSGVIDFLIGVGANPTGGPDLQGLGSLTGYANDDLNFDSGPGTDGDGAHSNVFHGVDFDLSSTPLDSIYVVYWNAINSDETGGTQGISIGEQPDNGFGSIPEPNSILLLSLAFLCGCGFRRAS